MILFVFGINAQHNQIDAKGRKQGEWYKTYPNSLVYQYKGQFKDDKPIGTFTYFYPNKNVKAVIKHDDKSSRSLAYFYHENGQIMSYGIFHNMKKDSVWLNFGPSGRISNTETYKMDILDGKKTVYFVPEDPNDKSQRVMSVMYYKDGKAHGEYKEFFDVGIPKVTGTYDNNKKVGEWITYHPNGKVMNFERYKNGVRHGWCNVNDMNGKEISKSYYYYGRKLEGDQLKEKMRQMKELGINPNG